ncbi:SBP (S-ribonuclease binding protein) family protein [Striga hermonthica]|uniref:SBP (S-ribonuclease binding protein) family protein n=1 Tax=Striga hermonthica TaxID=68872 RepID=A0A9N7RF22_STRHE|nr:SBP (S-ribonuclease binding protein) family protein [Striga hermonthica]
MAIQAQMYSGFGFEGSQDYLTDNACGLNFTTQQQKLQDEQQLMRRVPPGQPTPFMSRYNTDYQLSGAFYQTVCAQFDKQRNEIDLFISSQNERLRMAVQEKRRQQTSQFMKKYESKIQNIIRQKDEEIEKAGKRTAELQDYLRRMEIERQTWQSAARESEAAAASLSSAINRLREAAGGGCGAAGDAESCCCPGDGDGMGKLGNLEGKMICKMCNVRVSCMIMLPCKHLCSCRDCEALLESCPVCKVAKRASIEALI